MTKLSKMQQNSMHKHFYQKSRNDKNKDISTKSFTSFNKDNYKSWGNINSYKEDIKTNDDAIR